MAYTPTLALRKVDPAKVLAAYTDGAWRAAALPERVRVESASAACTTGQAITLRDTSNCIVLLHMSNNDQVRAQPAFRARCYWCMEDVADGVPLPVAMAAWRQGGPAVFDCEGQCCSFECALAFCRNHGEQRERERREVLLRSLHALQRPGEALAEAPDFRLHAAHGGTITADAFRTARGPFVPLPNVAVRQASRLYMAF